MRLFGVALRVDQLNVDMRFVIDYSRIADQVMHFDDVFEIAEIPVGAIGVEDAATRRARLCAARSAALRVCRTSHHRCACACACVGGAA